MRAAVIHVTPVVMVVMVTWPMKRYMSSSLCSQHNTGAQDSDKEQNQH